MRFRVNYTVEDTCSIIVNADSEEGAVRKVMSGDFEEDDTYDFLECRISRVNFTQPL